MSFSSRQLLYICIDTHIQAETPHEDCFSLAWGAGRERGGFCGEGGRGEGELMQTPFYYLLLNTSYEYI